MNLGLKIKRARRKAGLTQEQMSDLTGLKQEYISQIEKGHIKKPRKETLKKIEKIISWQK